MLLLVTLTLSTTPLYEMWSPIGQNIVSLSINWNHIINILMDFVVSYTRQWANREKENIYTISE